MARHFLTMGINNDYGYAFQGVEMRWNVIDPFKALPSPFHWDLVYGDSKENSHSVDIKDDLLTLKVVERFYSGITFLPFEETTTISEIHIDPSFTQLSDMTFTSEARKIILGHVISKPSPSVITTCAGRFTLEKNIVTEHN